MIKNKRISSVAMALLLSVMPAQAAFYNDVYAWLVASKERAVLAFAAAITLAWYGKRVYQARQAQSLATQSRKENEAKVSRSQQPSAVGALPQGPAKKKDLGLSGQALISVSPEEQESELLGYIKNHEEAIARKSDKVTFSKHSREVGLFPEEDQPRRERRDGQTVATSKKQDSPRSNAPIDETRNMQTKKKPWISSLQTIEEEETEDQLLTLKAQAPVGSIELVKQPVQAKPKTEKQQREAKRLSDLRKRTRAFRARV